jgi:predicted dehydrogenase
MVTVVDQDPGRLAAISASIPGIRTCSSLDEALPWIDACVVATPPTSHVALAREAIEAGKHVLVEKPVALDSLGVRELADAAHDQGVALMAGHTFEYNAAVWKLRQLIDDGVLGELHYLDSARLNLGLYQSDVNVIMDLAPHDVSIVNFLVGRPATAVEAWGGRHAHARLEDVAYLRLFYEDSDLTANIHVSWLDPCKVRRVTAVGSQKMAVYNDLALDERIRVHDKGVVFADADPSALRSSTSYRHGDIVSPHVDFEEPLAVQDRHFLDCIRNDHRPLTDWINALNVVKTLEAAQVSLSRHRSVELDEVDDVTLSLQPERALSTAV